MVRPIDQDFLIQVPSRLAHWYVQEGYETLSSAIFRRSAANSDIVIDIGAHMGFYSLLAASANPSSRVIAIEASPGNAKALRENVEINDFRNVEIINAVFCDQEGETDFLITSASDNCGISGHPNSPTVETTRVKTISGESLGLNGNESILAKIDVEGHEEKALKGLGKIISEASSARLLIEFNPKCIRNAGKDPHDIIRTLLGHDFRIFAIDDKMHRWKEYPRKEQSIEEAADQITSEAGESYLNIWCLPGDSALSIFSHLHSAGTGGAERSHVEFVSDMVSMDCMVHTIVPKSGGPIVPLLHRAGSSVSSVDGGQWWASAFPHDQSCKAIYSSEITDQIAEVDPDVVLTQTAVIPQSAIGAAFLGKPHIWWLREFCDIDHGLSLPLRPEKMGGIIRSLSTYVFANSEAVAKHYFPDSFDSVIIKSPMPQTDKPSQPRQPTKSTYSVGVIASLQQGKGHVDVITAVTILSLRGLDIELKIFGYGDQARLEALNQVVTNLRVADRVTIMGQVNDRTRIYSQIDVAVVSSRAEAFGRVAIEATNAGLPVILTDSGGAAESMIPGETGLTYTPGDAVTLANAIERLHMQPEDAEAMVRRAQRHFASLKISNRYSSEHTKTLLRAAVSTCNQNPAVVLASLLAKQMNEERRIINSRLDDTITQVKNGSGLMLAKSLWEL